MEVASVETNYTIGDTIGMGKQITLYKVKDNDGNPCYMLCVSHAIATFTFGTVDAFSMISIPNGVVLLDFGPTYQDAMDNLDALLAMYELDNGAQKELRCTDGSTVQCTLHKGLLGKHLDIEGTDLNKSDVKSLKTSLKISKKLHRDL